VQGLRSEGYEVVLVNSNPATIMTDPEIADRTYVEPLTKEYVEQIIAVERPQALLPTVGGQTGLNLAVELAESGILEKYGVELIGASLRAIKVAEDRLWFKDAIRKVGLDVPASALVNNAQDGLKLADQLGYPVVIRPSFTLGGTGGSIAYNREEFSEAIAHALDASPVHEALVEESVLGWKEYELEVMRDCRDNFVVICSIENFDPMGVHTGDSITVAPAQTLTDKEYQRMRDAAAAIIREVGVETGGSNIQFAIDPATGRMIVIEMNPRVSRSSALASKATGFPIAKIAARLAVGMTLDEIPNDITQKTPSCFEPTIDYVVVKIPKWQFEKFPGADSTLGTQMKSVGEVMAIGRTFKEALQKGIRSLEPSSPWRAPADTPVSLLREKIATPRPDRIHWLFVALERGISSKEVIELTKIDPWFIQQMQEIVAVNRGWRRSRWRPFRRFAARSQAHRHERRAARANVEDHAGGRAPSPRPRRASRPYSNASIPARRNSSPSLPTCIPPMRTRTSRNRPTAQKDRHPRQRPEPHRAGNRIRLLLLPRLLRAARRRLRNHHDQLQSGDGFDRLRHFRPPVLRAAHAGRRSLRRRSRKAAGRDRAVRRADSAQPGAGIEAQRRADHRHRAGID
jgi:carbamoyl-phosphate synthase large subunit